MNEIDYFQSTPYWMDFVDLSMAVFLYEICNDNQFTCVSGSDFINFLNLKPTSQPVSIRLKEKLRICYMVLSVSLAIKPADRGRQWAAEFLKICGIPMSYYIKHRNDVCNEDTTNNNKLYRKAIDEAIDNAKKLNIGT